MYMTDEQQEIINLLCFFIFFRQWLCLDIHPHPTRPNSGPDKIILAPKISNKPIRCCLHIRAKFWSAAAVDNSGPKSVSTVFTSCMCSLNMMFTRFHFIFIYFWITKQLKRAYHKFRFSLKEGAVFWDTLPRGIRIFMKNNALEEQGLSFFFKY